MMNHCPRYQTCNASVCLLDPIPTVHLSGEPVCFYLRSSGKEGAAERFKEDPIFAAVLQAAPAVLERHPAIARVVTRAAETGFRSAGRRPPSRQKNATSGVALTK